MASEIGKLAGENTRMASGIDHIIGEISLAISNVAESAQNTLENSRNLLFSTNEVSGVVAAVADKVFKA